LVNPGSAVDVVNQSAKPSAREIGKEGIAEVAVHKRHRAFFKNSVHLGQTAALHECVSFAQFHQKGREIAEIIAVISIRHNKELPRAAVMRPINALPWPFSRTCNTRAPAAPQLEGAFSTAVVRNDNFTAPA
jgi:hypothetical protein